MGKATSATYYTSGAGASGGFESYYLDAVTEGEPPGVWSGRLAQALGLAGQVDARVMEQVFGRFEDPATGGPLGSRPQKWRSVDERLAAALEAEPDALPERVAQLRADIEARTRSTVIGWDATFNVPKSVTVAHTAVHRAQIAAARSGNTTRAQQLAAVRAGIEAAVLDANRAGIAVLQDLAVARTGGGSGTAQQWVRADQVAVASFLQHTNREVDPHLHVHNVVLNRAVCADGKVRALDGKDLLAQQYAFSAVADRALFEALARLGLDSIARADGLGRELACIPADAIEHFSTRRARITAALAPLVEAAEQAKGRPLTDWETYQLKQTVTLATRAAKDHTAWSREELLRRWDDVLTAVAGRTLDGLADTVLAEIAHGPVTGPALPDWSPTAVITEAVAACAERSATWGRANLTNELELRLPILGLDTDRVAAFLDHLTDTALASGHVVAVTGHTPDLDNPHTTSSTSNSTSATTISTSATAANSSRGGVVGTAGLAPNAPSARRYAATGTLAAEIALREAAVTRSGTALAPDAVNDWLDTHTPTIGDDQRAAVTALAATRAAVSVLIGPAGTGKSYTAGALAAAWTALTTPNPSPPGQPGQPGWHGQPGQPGAPADPGGQRTPGGQGGQGEPGRVLGLAVSQIATTVLLDDGLPHAANIAAFLATQNRLDRADTTSGTAGGTGRPGRPGLDGDDVWRIRPNDIVLVDEASMVATADLDAIRRRVTAAGARMILTGDPRQLAAVQAGGALDVLAGHADTYTLTDVRRFHVDWERDASLALRDAGTAPNTTPDTSSSGGGAGPAGQGRPALSADDALAVYDRHGRLLDHPSLDAALDAAARAAVADRLDGRTTVVVTGTNDAAARTATRIRDTLVGLGRVEPAGVHLDRDGCTAGVGDIIACRRNDYTLGVTNRQQYLVHAVGDDGSLTVAPLPTNGSTTQPAQPAGSGGVAAGPVPAGTLIDLPAAYVTADVQLGYACTVHAAQGITVDIARLVTDGGLDPAGIYVALTRGRSLNIAHVAVTNDPNDNPTRAQLPDITTGHGAATVLDGTTTRASARAVLASAWATRPASASAVVTAETDAAHRASAATILSDIENHTRIACRARMDTHLDDLVADHILDTHTRARLATDQASEHLSRLLRTVEQTGADPRTTLTDALTNGTTPTGDPAGAAGRSADAVRASFADTHSVAQVLSHRITNALRHTLTTPTPPTAGPAAADTADDTTGGADAAAGAGQDRRRMPAGLHPEDTARLADLHAALDRRAADLGHQLAQDPPRWALLALGDVPQPPPDQTAGDVLDEHARTPTAGAADSAITDGAAAELAADRADWEHRAGLAAAHREAVGWDHPDQALPTMPGVSATERRASYTAAWDALCQPPGRLDETQMSEGRLRARITAWDREQAWAPPHADTALKNASIAAEHARQAAILADAEHRPDDAARHRADAARHTTLAATYEQVTRARAQWAARTHTTRIHAENARDELTRRGITPGHEPDHGPTPRHLHDAGLTDHDHHVDIEVDDQVNDLHDTDEAARRAADDEHRTITETDIPHTTPADDAWTATAFAPDTSSINGTGNGTTSTGTGTAAGDGHGAVPVLELDLPEDGQHTPPARGGRRAAREVLDPAADLDTDATEALTQTAATAARIAADQASQDTAFTDRAADEDATRIAAAGARRRAARHASRQSARDSEWATQDDDEWARRPGRALDEDTTHDEHADYNLDHSADQHDADEYGAEYDGDPTLGAAAELTDVRQGATAGGGL